MITELFDWLSVQTRIPHPWDVVDNLILANKPSREDWGSHVDHIDIQREQRGAAYVVYQIKGLTFKEGFSYYGISSYLEILKCGENETLLRLWTPSAGPSGRSRAPYADFPYMPFADLLSACRRAWEWDPNGPTAESWRLLLGLASYLLNGLEPFLCEQASAQTTTPDSKRPIEAPEPLKASSKPRVPNRPKDLARWKAIWAAIAGQRRHGKSYAEMLDWLNKMHPGWQTSEKTLSDICEAGEAGLLG